MKTWKLNNFEKGQPVIKQDRISKDVFLQATETAPSTFFAGGGYNLAIFLLTKFATLRLLLFDSDQDRYSKINNKVNSISEAIKALYPSPGGG